MKITLLLNNNLNFLFLKKNLYKYILIFNKDKNIYIKYKININSNIYFIKNINCIFIEIKSFNNQINIINIFNLFLNKQIKSIYFYFNQKIIFFGKGFKIKKLKKNVFNLFFNRSHINFFK